MRWNKLSKNIFYYLKTLDLFKLTKITNLFLIIVSLPFAIYFYTYEPLIAIIPIIFIALNLLSIILLSTHLKLFARILTCISGPLALLAISVVVDFYTESAASLAALIFMMGFLVFPFLLFYTHESKIVKWLLAFNIVIALAIYLLDFYFPPTILIRAKADINYIATLIVFIEYILILWGYRQFSDYQESKIKDYITETTELTIKLSEEKETIKELLNTVKKLNQELKQKNLELEQRYREAEYNYKFLKAIADNASDGIIIFDKKARVIFVNRAASNIFNLTPDEIIGNQIFEIFKFYVNIDFSKRENLLKIVRSNLKQTLEYKFLVNDKIRYIAINLDIINFENQKFFLAILRDVTENKKQLFKIIEQQQLIKEQNEELKVLNEELTRKEQLFRAITTNANDAIIIVDQKLRITFWNKAAEKIFGYSEKEILYKPFYKYIIPKEIYNITLVEKLAKFKKGIKNFTKEPFSSIARTKDNDRIYIEISLASIQVNQQYYMVAVVRDITERKKFIQKLQEQKQLLQEAYNDLQESILYAKRLQDALLPQVDWLTDYFAGYFIFWKVKATVSGDFYYITKVKDKVIIFIGDCTGHGVPGAFLTSLSIAFLKDIIYYKGYETTAHALELLRDHFAEALHQKQLNIYDSLDAAFLEIDLNTLTLKYSSSYILAFIIKPKQRATYILKFDRIPLSAFLTNKKFSQKEIQLQKGDKLYVTTDGFIDQIGGPHKKKYSRKKFLSFINEIADKPMPEQKQLIEKEFNSWINNYEQMDDILIFGLEI